MKVFEFRAEVKTLLHSANLGYVSVIQRKKNTWLGISKRIQKTSDSCHICHETKPNNEKDALYQHD